jgi:hypothetical protein
MPRQPASRRLTRWVSCPRCAALHDTSVAMIESHYAAYVTDAMDDLAAKAIIPLTTASAQPLHAVRIA